jgi:ribokinase
MFDIITIGRASQDVFLVSDNLPEEILDVYFEIGGSGVSTAVAYAKLGFNTAVIVKVGDDLAGDMIVKNLKTNKIAADFVLKDKKNKTAFSVLSLVNSQITQSKKFTGINTDFIISDIPLTKLKTKWLHLTGFGADLKLLSRIVESCQKKKIKIAWSPSLEEVKGGLRDCLSILRKLDVLVLNLEQAMALSDEDTDDVRVLFDSISVATPGVIAITDGKQGAYVAPAVAEQAVVYFAPPVSQEVTDPTGAGDAFASGLIAGLIKYEDLEPALQLAILSSGSVVKSIGAQSGLLKLWPNKSQLNKIRVTKQ